MLVLHIFALRRSGHHGIINWILKNAGCGQHYDDCVFDNQRNLVYRARKSKGLPKRYLQNINNYDGPITILNGEDQLIYSRKEWFPKRIDYRMGVVLRDPYNLMASRLIGKYANETALDLWKSHAKKSLRPDIICFNYNKWFEDRTYRQQLIEDLGFKFNDAGLQEVSLGRSSFDKLKYDGKAQQMDVLNRWKHIPDNKWQIFDEEIVDLCKLHFNFYIDVLTKEIIRV